MSELSNYQSAIIRIAYSKTAEEVAKVEEAACALHEMEYLDGKMHFDHLSPLK